MIYLKLEYQESQYIRSNVPFLLLDKTNNHANLLFNTNNKNANNYISNTSIRKMTNINICSNIHQNT